jgi:hypothetical protein
MSKMGQTIMDIQEMFFSGMSVPDIAKATKTTASFVNGVVETLDGPDDEFDYEYPEPEADF